MSTSVPPPGFEATPTPGSATPLPAPGGAERPAPGYVPQAASPASDHRRLLAAGGLGLVVVGVLAFLLLGSGGGPLSDPVAQAATVSSQTAGYRMHMTINASADGIPLNATADGVVDLPDHAASMSMTMDMSQIPQAAQALGGSTTMQLGMIMVGGDMYMRFPATLASHIPSLGSKPWLKLNLSKLTGLPGLSSVMSSPTTTDPTQVLRYLRADSDSITSDGNQVVGGVQTTHYSVELNLDHLPANLPAADQAGFQKALSQVEQVTGVHDLPADVWIDAHHLVRQMVMTLDMHPGTGPAIQETITVDLSDYGRQQPPTPPPADQVQDLTSALGGSGGLTPGG